MAREPAHRRVWGLSPGGFSNLASSTPSCFLPKHPPQPARPVSASQTTSANGSLRFPNALPQRKPPTLLRGSCKSSCQAHTSPCGPRNAAPSSPPSLQSPIPPARPPTHDTTLNFLHRQQPDRRCGSGPTTGAAKRKFNYSFPDRATAPERSRKGRRMRSGNINCCCFQL